MEGAADNLIECSISFVLAIDTLLAHLYLLRAMSLSTAPEDSSVTVSSGPKQMHFNLQSGMLSFGFTTLIYVLDDCRASRS